MTYTAAHVIATPKFAQLAKDQAIETLALVHNADENTISDALDSGNERISQQAAKMIFEAAQAIAKEMNATGRVYA